MSNIKTVIGLIDVFGYEDDQYDILTGIRFYNERQESESYDDTD